MCFTSHPWTFAICIDKALHPLRLSPPGGSHSQIMPKPKNAFEISIRNTYLARLSTFLQEIYSDRSSPIGTRTEKHQRLSGFIEATLISRVLTNADIQSVVNDEHQRAYGLTMKERNLIQQKILAACENHDWSSFEEPSFKRHKPTRALQRGRSKKSVKG